MKRNRIVKLLGVVMSVLVCAFFLPAPHAYAADITVSGVSTTPTSLTAGGDVTVKGKITNTTGEPITLTIEYGGVNKVASQSVAVDGSYSFSVSCAVSESDLGTTNTYLVVDWASTSSSSLSGTKKVPFTVQKAATTVKLDFSRTMDKTSVASGGTVKITYNLKNTGTVPITNLSVTDPAVPDGVASGLSLAAGASKQVIKSITVTQTVTSTPKVTYTANGSTHTASLTAKKITTSEPALSISAIADKSLINSGESVTFTIAVRNDSTVAVSGINITDDQGTAVKSGLSIAASATNDTKTTTFTYAMTLTAPRSVTFTASYPSGSTTKTAASTPVIVNINGQPFLSAEPTNITIEASASATAVAFPSDVTFTITVKNIGAVALQSIAVTETRLGDIGTVESLAVGASQTLTKTATLSAAGTYTFQVSAKDAEGTTYTSSAGEIAITAATPSPDVVSPNTGDSLGTLFIIMIVIVVLIIIAAIALFVLMMQEKRARNKKNGPRPPKGGGGPGLPPSKGGPGGGRNAALKAPARGNGPSRTRRIEEDGDSYQRLPRPQRNRVEQSNQWEDWEEDASFAPPAAGARQPQERSPYATPVSAQRGQYDAEEDEDRTRQFSKAEVQQAQRQRNARPLSPEPDNAYAQDEDSFFHNEEAPVRPRRPVSRPVPPRPPEARRHPSWDSEEASAPTTTRRRRPVTEEEDQWEQAPEDLSPRPRPRRPGSDPGYGPSGRRRP